MKKRGTETDREKETEEGRQKRTEKGKGGTCKKKSGCVYHGAVLEESGQAAALHANRISQLRELFVHWPRWLLRARGLPSSSLPLH